MAGSRIYTAEMGQPPMDPEVAPPTPKAKKPKEKPVRVPQDIDGASAGKPMRKGEYGVPEQPGEGIRVEGKAKGGFLTATKKGGSISASKRADGIAMRGKTRGKVI